MLNITHKGFTLTVCRSSTSIFIIYNDNIPYYRSKGLIPQYVPFTKLIPNFYIELFKHLSPRKYK